VIWPLIAGVALAVFSALVHALGLLGLLYWQARRWPKIEENFGPRRNLPVFLTLFCVILALHVTEIFLWAGFYWWRDFFPDLETSVYFSASSYSTAGYSDIVLSGSWRLVGVLESLTGLLLLGWSAAFFFSTVHRFFEIRVRRWQGATREHAPLDRGELQQRGPWIEG
jgi:voltage-gated potassium channel